MARTHLPDIDELYRTHGPAVLRRARQILHDESEALEVLHDVFESLLERPDQFRGESSPMTFLYRVTTNRSLTRLRRNENRARLLRAQRPVTTPTHPGSVELRRQAIELLQSLPEELAQVAVYHHLDEMTQGEIAETLGCSRQWVGKLLSRLGERTREREHAPNAGAPNAVACDEETDP